MTTETILAQNAEYLIDLSLYGISIVIVSIILFSNTSKNSRWIAWTVTLLMLLIGAGMVLSHAYLTQICSYEILKVVCL